MTCRALLTIAIAIPGAAALLASGAGAVGATTPTPPWPMAQHDPAHTATSAVVGPHTGTILWTRDLGGNVTPSPVVGADDTIYLASNAGVLHALDGATGADRWTFDGGGPFTGETDLSTSPLILPSGSILWPGPGHVLYEVTPSGTEVWSHRFSGSLLSPVRVGSTVYVVSMSGTVSRAAGRGFRSRAGVDAPDRPPLVRCPGGRPPG